MEGFETNCREITPRAMSSGRIRRVVIDHVETADEIAERHRLLRMFAKHKDACATPTAAAPGSEEKNRIMSERYAAGLPIFHPDDIKGPERFAMQGFFSGLDAERDQPTDDDFDDVEGEFDIGGEG